MRQLRVAAGRARLAVKRLVARGLILTYHRVAEDDLDPWRLCVSPANFARQLEKIRAAGLKPVTVSELVAAMCEGRLARGTVAVTFDDGYRDNVEIARPILERFEIPATHFAAAGYIGTGQAFWWDVLDRIFLRAPHIPDVLEITLDGHQHRWSFGADTGLAKGGDRAWPKWKPFQSSPTPRHAVHDELWKLLVSALPAERERIIKELTVWAELGGSEELPGPMSVAELRALRGDGLVEIGAHSMTHPALSALPPSLQSHELTASKAHLEAMLGVGVAGCSYPQGGSSPQVQQLARDAGYTFACGSAVGTVRKRSDRFHLPRVSVRNWEDDHFEALLAQHIAA